MFLVKTVSMLAAYLVAPGVLWAANLYELNALPMPPGTSFSSASSVSPNGIVGQSFVGDWDQQNGVYQATFWHNSQSLQMLTPAGYQSWALAINSTGEIAGAIRALGSEDPQPVVWRQGQMQLLDTLGRPSGGVFSINSSGAIVGAVYSSQGRADAIKWSGDQVTVLGGFSEAVGTTSLSINSAGQVLLGVEYDGHSESWIWTDGGVVQITSPGANIVTGSDINNLGHVVGITSSAGQTGSSGLFWQDGVASILPALSGDDFNSPAAINDSDMIVGRGSGLFTGTRALLWENGRVFDLNELIPADSGWRLLEATDIGNDGTIVGYGSYNGQIRAFQLIPTPTPNPEPATAGVLLLGGMILLRRRRSYVEDQL